MKRLLLNGLALSFLIVFFIGTGSSNVFGQDNQRNGKTVEVTIEFSKVDGLQGGKPKLTDGWVALRPDEKVPDGAEVIYEGIIKVYKVNPCYVCSGGQCYYKDPC